MGIAGKRAARAALFAMAAWSVSLPALANVVWPALHLEQRLLTWWSIGIGLLVEYCVVRWLWRMTPARAALATLVANAVSTLVGIGLIPSAGFVWELFPGLLMYHLFEVGTFNPVTWAATFVIGCLANAVIEGLVYRFGFKLAFGRRAFLWVLLANALSVGAAFASLFVFPAQP